MDSPPVEVKQQLKHETCRQRVRRAFQRGFVEEGSERLLVPPPCSYNNSRNTNRAGNKYDGRSSVVFIEESGER